MGILKTACILLPAAAVICAGQGSISGKILTAAGAGAAVPKAPVKAKNLATQTVYSAMSTADGNYRVPDIPY